MDFKLLEQKIRENNTEDLQAFMKSFESWQEEMRKKDEELLQLNNKDDRMSEGSGDEEIDIQVIKHEQADQHKQKGNDFVKVGKWQEAIEEYTKSIELYPNDAAYYGNRSYCYLQLNNWQDAESDCDRALELKPDYVKVALRRGKIRRRMGNVHGAAKDYNLVLILEPKNSVALKEYEELYPELKSNLAEVGVNLPEFIDMNTSTRSTQDDESKQINSNFYLKKEKLVKTTSTTKQAGKHKIVENQQEVRNENTSIKSAKSTNNNNNENNKAVNYSVINPIRYKPPHLRSKVPLRRIQIDDVYLNSEEELSIDQISIMEENGNCAVNSESIEDLSEYTDADESMSAPTEILAEFLSAVMLKDYENALKYCKMILQYEPNHATAKEFYPLILEKIIQGATKLVGNKYKRSSPSSSSLSSRGDSDDSESDNVEGSDSDAEEQDGEEEEEEDEDVSAESSSRGTSSSSSGSPAEERLSSPESDGTTASYSSIEDEVADNSVAIGMKPGESSGSVPHKADDNSFKTNGNKETSDSESPTEPVSQRLTDRLMAAVFPNVL